MSETTLLYNSAYEEETFLRETVCIFFCLLNFFTIMLAIVVASGNLVVFLVDSR